MTSAEPTAEDLRTLSTAIGAALQAETGETTAWGWPPRQDPDRFAALAIRHRVTEILLESPALTLPVDVEDALRAARTTQRIATLSLLRGIGDVTETLLANGVRSLPIKGPALALQTTGSALGRGYGDIDILIDQSDFWAAVETLVSEGWSPASGILPVRGSWADRHMLSTAQEMSFYRGTLNVDLHWRLDPAPGAMPGFDDVWQRRVVVADHQFTTVTLAPLDALKHSCGHAARDEWARLRSLADIVRLTRHPELPAGWRESLRPVDRRTLAITARTFAPTLAFVDGADGRAGAWRRTTLARVHHRQLDPGLNPTDRRLLPPWLASMRSLSRGSRRPGDLLVIGRMVLLSGTQFAAIEQEHSRQAIPRAIGIRAADLRDKLRARVRARLGGRGDSSRPRKGSSNDFRPT